MADAPTDAELIEAYDATYNRMRTFDRHVHALRAVVEKFTPSPPVAAPPAMPYKHVEPTCEDAALLWAEIHHLRAAVQGPEGFATWQEAATAERVRRVKAERAAQPQPQPAQPLTETQVVALLCELNGAIYESASPTEMFSVIVRAVERLHGITAPSTPPPGEKS